MDDGEQDSVHAALTGDPRVLIATTLAAFFFAGSAYMWRSLPKSVLASPHQRGLDNAKGEGTYSTAQCTGTKATAVNGSGESGGLSGDVNQGKSFRSKERRRRGKDPAKELLKSAKKSKSFLKPSKPTLDLSDTPESPRPMSQSFREQPRTARGSTTSSSGRSRSPSRASLDRQPLPSMNMESDNSDTRRTQDTTEHEDDPFSNVTPTASRMLSFGTDTIPQNPFAVASASDSASAVASSSQESTVTTRPSEYPAISLSASSSTSNSGSVLSSTSNLTPNTSPTLSPPWEDASPLPPTGTSSTLQDKNMAESVSLPSVSEGGAPGPWDWDGSGPSVLPSRKPPRFRPKSRGGSGTISMSPSIPESAILSRIPEPSTSDSGIESSTNSADQIPEDAATPFTFPSLNGSSATPVSSPVAPTSNRNPSVSVPRRVPTPRRPPTPHLSTSPPPPSLSVQTQLASLRGALEAARIREEKNKVDIEKYVKELEFVRYEWAASRSREIDLQNQIHHLAHQVQMFASMVGSAPRQPNPSTSTPMPTGHAPNSSTSQPSSNDTSTPSAQPNGYQFPPPPSMNPQTPSHLHLSPAQAQMYLPSGLLSSPTVMSPLSMSHLPPHSPFHPYPYPPIPAMSAMHSPYHYASPSPMFAALYSNLGKGPDSTSRMGGGGSGPSSATGSSSAGSQSPEMGAGGGLSSSSTPPPGSDGSSMSVDRGRRRTRGNGGDELGLDGDGIGNVSPGDLDEQSLDETLAAFGAVRIARRSPTYPSDGDDGEDSEGPFNDILEDAILKRPGSIRGLSRRKKDGDGGRDNVQTIEFTFPSLSSFGNVNVSRGSLDSSEGSIKEEASQSSEAVVSESIEAGKIGVGAETTIEGEPGQVPQQNTAADSGERTSEEAQ